MPPEKGSLVTLGIFGLFNWEIRQLTTTKTSAYINLVPVVAVVIGWIALNKTLSLQQCLAAECVIAGVWISRMRSKPDMSRVKNI